MAATQFLKMKPMYLRFSEEYWKSWKATALQYVTRSDNSRANFIVFLGFLLGS